MITTHAHRMSKRRTFAAAMLYAAAGTAAAQADAPRAPESAASVPALTLPPVTVNASADAAAQGLTRPYAGGQVARGGRVGILGTRDYMETPFNTTSYTNDLIQQRQAQSVGDVLQMDPGVRVARGFGNFQESYFIRGFVLSSDDVAYNGLYSLLPRQYIATELFERVEVVRGATAFLNGANPGGGGIGGAINLLPKRAPNEPLTRATLAAGSGEAFDASVDVARRFGPDQSGGWRLVAAGRSGGTAVEDESAKLGLVALGLDWRSSEVRLSGDLGLQDNRLKRSRTNISLAFDATEVPRLPDASDNWAQPWSFSRERDLFGTFRGEWDLRKDLTAWAAYGLRRSDEANSLANIALSDATSSGAATIYRFDNTREDEVDTAELGLRGKLRTGPVGHEWVVSAAYFELEKKNAYAFDFFNQLATDLYDPIDYDKPDFSAGVFRGNDLDSPALNGRTRLVSFAIADTLAFVDDSVLLTLGARRQTLKIQNFAYNTGELDAYDESRTTPVVGLVWRLRKELSLYANYIEALTQGETAPLTNLQGRVPNGGEQLAPYVSKQREVGLKFDARTVGGSLALFSTTRPRATYDADNRFVADGEDRHRGVELSVFGRPMQGLSVVAGANWLQAEQRKTGSNTTDGQRVIGTPRFQANVSADWDVPGVDGFALDARVVHTGSSYYDSANTLRVPGWTRLDLGASYEMEVAARTVILRARIDNATNRDYWASVGGFPEAGYLVVGGPRSFNLSASVDF